MRGISLKTIFIILVIILVIIAIYNNVYNKKEKEDIVADTIQNKGENTLISNDIRIGIIDFDNINPILSNNKNVQDISRLIFEPLFTVTQDYKLQESLATEWSKIDSTTYVVKLRENVKWQDGNSFDVSDVIFTIDMLKSLKSKSIYYYNVKNISSIEEIDEYTLKIVLDKEIPYFEYNFIFPIVSSKYFTKEDFTLENKNVKPVGTGMYYISDINDGNILLKKNINSWSDKIIKIDTITLNLYNSLSSVIEAFKLENIDIFTTSNTNIEEYLKNINYNKSEYINRNYMYITLNCNNKILKNLEVRQAINSAINKDEIIKKVYNNKYRVSNFPLDFGNYAYDKNNTIIAYDKNTAKRLLVDAGWKYYSKKWRKTVNYRYLKIELNIVVNKEETNMVKIANKIKEQLEEIGFNINITEATKKQYKAYLENKKYDIILQNGTYSYSPSLERYFNNKNVANYKNNELVQILSNIENESDENKIREDYSKIINIYNNEVPYISLCFDTSTLIYSNQLKGTIAPNSYNLFYGIEGWYREYKEK